MATREQYDEIMEYVIGKLMNLPAEDRADIERKMQEVLSDIKK